MQAPEERVQARRGLAGAGERRHGPGPAHVSAGHVEMQDDGAGSVEHERQLLAAQIVHCTGSVDRHLSLT
jgi:hypothetical protein